MSQENITSVLLPAARVDVFALDDGTAALAQQLSENWRFARVGMRVERAGIEAAIEYYKTAQAPELIVIETNDIGDDFIQQLGALAGVCSAGTDAVVIGPKNDVHLYRHLVEMGVRDYLVRPVSEEDMLKVIARTLIDKRGMLASRLVAVMGSKGGVGCTTVAQLLAWDISELHGQKTMLMDAAGSAGSIGIAFGLEPSTTLTEAVRIGASGTDDDMKRIGQTISEHLSALVCGGDSLLTVSPDPDAIEALINRVMQKYPVVVIDLSGANPVVQKRVLSRASEVVVVSTPMLAALRNARSLMAEIKSIKASLKEVDLVINMRGMAPHEEVPAKDINAAMGIDPAAIIPYEPKIFVASETTGKAVGRGKDAEKITGLLMPIAGKASSTEVKATAGTDKKSGLVSSLKKLLGSK